MKPWVSAYFDLARFGSAVLVVLFHVWPVVFPAHPLPWPGHDAVIVFFVLSGYVIAYVIDRKERSISDFALSRLARVWSVAVPALLLAALASPLIGSVMVSEAAPPAPSAASLGLRTLFNLFFVGQCWGLDIWPPLNLPFWSLDYEVWYYAIFGAWACLGARYRTWFAILLALIAGPKILLLMPCFLLGVWLYRRPVVLCERSAIALFLGTILAYLVFFQVDLPVVIRNRMDLLWPATMHSLAWSRTFVGDWVLAVIVSANFIAVANLGRFGYTLLRWERPLRSAASYSFSIYLYHMPLLALFWAGFRFHHWSVWLVLSLAIVVLAGVTEHRRARVRLALARLAALSPAFAAHHRQVP